MVVCFVVIEAILILGLVISELAAPKKKPTTQAGIIVVLCLITLLFALSTLFGVMMVGSYHYGEITAGVKTGAGLWLAMLGTLICAAGQGLAVGYDPPLLPSQPKQTEKLSSSRCAKCGTDLLDTDFLAKKCSTCGADWSSSNTPPPIPNSSSTDFPSSELLSPHSNAQTGLQPTPLPSHTPNVIRRKRSRRGINWELIVIGIVVIALGVVCLVIAHQS